MSNQRTPLASPKKKYLQTKLSFAPLNNNSNNNNDENKRPASTLSSQSSSSSSSSTSSNKKFKTLNNDLKVSLTETSKSANTKNKPTSLKRTITPTEEISRLSFTTPLKQKQPQQPVIIEPPTLKPINLLYSESELWIRLQIREFVFRFGDYFEIDSRAVTSLQNTQGNWRVKRLAVNLTYQLLTSMEQGLIDIPSSSFETPTDKDSLFYGARTGQQFAQRVLFKWLDHYGLNNNRYLEKEAARVAFVENLERDGLSVHHWEDLVDLFSVITGTPKSSSLMEDEENEGITTKNKNNEINALPEPEQVIHSLFEELRMLQIMCDMLLMHTSLRRIWVHEEQSKELKATETELKFERKRLESLSNEEKEGKHAQAERLQVEKKMVDVLTAQQKNMKRFAPAGYDTKGNEYWIFNDLVTYGNDARNSELYWGHGVIVIGPGFDSSNSNETLLSSSSQGDHQQKWWYVSDINDLTQLRRYILQDRSTSLSPSSSSSTNRATTMITTNTDTLAQQLTLRIHYMTSLQYIIAQGSTSSNSNHRRSTRV